jgi:ankyrin repeat protein
MGEAQGKCCRAVARSEEAKLESAGEAPADMVSDALSCKAENSVPLPNLAKRGSLPKLGSELQNTQASMDPPIFSDANASNSPSVQKPHEEQIIVVMDDVEKPGAEHNASFQSTVAPIEEAKTEEPMNNSFEASFQSACPTSEPDTINDSFMSNVANDQPQSTRRVKKVVKGGTKKTTNAKEQKVGDLVESKTQATDKDIADSKPVAAKQRSKHNHEDYHGADAKEAVKKREKDWKKLVQAEKMEKAAKMLALAKDGNRKEILEMIVAGVSPNCADVNGYTPLMQAAESGKSEVINLLFDLGADSTLTVRLGDWGRNALHFAATADHLDAAKLLLERGSKADVQAKDMYGKTPLSYAQNREMKKVLKKHM